MTLPELITKLQDLEKKSPFPDKIIICANISGILGKIDKVDTSIVVTQKGFEFGVVLS